MANTDMTKLNHETVALESLNCLLFEMWTEQPEQQSNDSLGKGYIKKELRC